MTGAGPALALLVAAGSMGSWMLRVAGAAPRHPVDSLLAAIVVGNGGLGVVGLALAAAGALEPWIVWLVLAAVAAPGVPSAVQLVRTAWRRRRRSRAGARLAGWALLGYAVLVLVAALAPSVTGDQTKYQLAYPKLYAAAGGLVSTPWTFWGQQQFLENFVFTLAFSIGDEITAHLAHAAIGGVAVVAVARLAARWLVPGWQWPLALLVATAPIMWSLVLANGSDLPLVGATALAVAGLLSWRAGEDGGLRRAALLAGVAGGTKVMGLLTPALVGVAAVIHAARGGVGRVVRTAVVFGALAGAVAAAPYVRNAVEVGNPLHPFAHGVFHGRDWSDAAGAYLEEYYQQYRAERARRRGGEPYDGLAVLRFPWDVTLYPESFERSARWALDMGPFMLATLPAAVWIAGRVPAARVIVLLGASFTTIVAAGLWAHPRYVLPGTLLLVAGGMGGLVRLAGRRIAATVVAVTVAGHLVVTARLAMSRFPDDLRVAIGALDRTAYLERHSPRFRFWRRANLLVPPGGLVLVLGKIPHPYFIDRPFVLGSYLEQTRLDYRRLDGVPALFAAARALGATHVVFESADLERGADPFERRVTRLWRDFRARLGDPLLRADGYELYRLPPGRRG